MREFPATLATSLLGLFARLIVKSLLRQQVVVISSISVWTMCQVVAKLQEGVVAERTRL